MTPFSPNPMTMGGRMSPMAPLPTSLPAFKAPSWVGGPGSPKVPLSEMPESPGFPVPTWDLGILDDRTSGALPDVPWPEDKDE